MKHNDRKTIRNLQNSGNDNNCFCNSFNLKILNMTAKEKAKELVEKFIEDMPPLANQTGAKITQHAKQCAIIAVDEIINSTPLSPNNVDWDDCGATHQYWYEAQREEAINYWNEVKTEITNL